MKKRNLYILISIITAVIIGLIIIYFSNRQNYEYINQNNVKNENTEGQFEKVNKFLYQKDKERIKSFLKRRNWEMKQTKSGLWYSIYHKGHGKKVEYGDFLKMKYEMRLLDGTLLYSSDSDGMKIIEYGNDKEIKGIHEGLHYLSEGDKARFIIPPHLAYGLIGDGKRVPARAIIFYQVEILKVSNKKISDR